MTSTELKIGLSTGGRPSSRVLKPPGGGHTNIFSEPEVAVNAPRPKYNQQNSSNLNACMGLTEVNKVVVEKAREEVIISQKDEQKPSSISQPKDNGNANKAAINNDQARGRVPPGGFSSGGFW